MSHLEEQLKLVMEEQAPRGFHKYKDGNTTYWRKTNWEISYNSKRWWEFKFQIESPHPEECEGREDEKMRIILYIFGFCIFYSFWRLLKRDWSFGFGWWSMGFIATYGIQTKKGGNIWSSDGSTGLKSYWSFPWQKSRCWQRITDESGKEVFFCKDRNWYQWKLIRLWRFITRSKPKPFMRDKFEEMDAAKKLVSQTFDFEYTLNSGEVQKRKITCHFSEDFRGWIAIPFIGSVTRYMEFEFDDEVGEKSGSYKGGLIATAIKRPKNATMLECVEIVKNKRW